MRRFEGRVALITGASRGIGLAVAERLVSEGATVVITGRKPESLTAAVEQLDAIDAGHAVGVAGKADDAEHRAEVFALVRERYGRLDHLVNNAGINPAYGPALEIESSVVRKILEVNVVAALDWTRSARGRRAQPVDRQHRARWRASRPARAWRSTACPRPRCSTSPSSSRSSWRRASASTRWHPPWCAPRLAQALYEGDARPRWRRATRSAASASRRTSPGRSRSCSPTTPPGSPVIPSPSTAAPVPSRWASTPKEREAPMATSSVVDDITRAAVDLFSTQGYANTSVQQIVEAAGVTKGAMYHYFESKDDLLFSVYERMLSLQTEHLEEIIGRGGPTAQTLRAVCVDVVETSIDFLPEGTVFFRSVHMLSEPRQKEVTRRRRQYHDVFAEPHRARPGRGAVPHGHPARRARRPLLRRHALPVELVLPRGSRGQGAPRASS